MFSKKPYQFGAGPRNIGKREKDLHINVRAFPLKVSATALIATTYYVANEEYGVGQIVITRSNG